MTAFLGLPANLEKLPDALRRVGQVVNSIMLGKTNNISFTPVTLTANDTTTTVTESAGRLGENTLIIFSPTTANAATAMTKIYVSSRDVENKQFTITHDNTADVDRTFNYILVG